MWHEDVPQIIATRDVMGWFSHGRLCPFTSAPITPIKVKLKFSVKEEQATLHQTYLVCTQIIAEYVTPLPQIKKVYLANKGNNFIHQIKVFISRISTQDDFFLMHVYHHDF